MTPVSRASGGSWLELGVFWLALGLLAATFLLISPPGDATYPGAQPWLPYSPLQTLTWAMSLGGLLSTVRGVEVKDVALHVACVAGLVLLAAQLLAARPGLRLRPPAGWAWAGAMIFLGLWVLLALASMLWAGDPDLAWRQAALYAFGVGWAFALACMLHVRRLPALLWGYVGLAACASLLCIWYYYERNPNHRPGFPIGNPGPLAATMLPAWFICAAAAATSLREALRSRASADLRVGVLALLALLVISGCLLLANARAAWIALAVGLGCMALLQTTRHVRRALVVVGLLGGLAAVGYLMTASMDDLAMARGAALRFRIYAWRYAAQLWSYRTVTGHGAGAYPRLVGPLAVGDRNLDSGAFMGENVEHAHNELFEVFVEIGLLGGVTFVAALIATLVAAAALLRTNLSSQRRSLLLGLTAGIAAILADASLGVGLRLPGLPAVFFTLLGALWAASRGAIAPAVDGAAAPPDAFRGAALRRAAGVLALAAAGALGAAALNNARGLVAEQRAETAMRAADHAAALGPAEAAARLLLDPVRVLIAERRRIEAEFHVASRAFQQWSELSAAVSDMADAAEAAAALADRRALALAAANRSYAAALAFEDRAPAFGHSTVVLALAAELLARLYEAEDAATAREWSRQGQRLWRLRAVQRPYEPQTLLALLRYPSTLQERITLLRDFLRSGFPTPEWMDAFRAAAEDPGFDAALQARLRSIAPYDPRTNLNDLVLSLAPETHRLAAIRAAQQQRFDVALAAAQRAAELYRPMRVRFPELRSVALAEQADFLIFLDPAAPGAALALLAEALGDLPQIQPQKLAALAQPFRFRALQIALLAGDLQEAARWSDLLAEQPERAAAVLADAHVALLQRVGRDARVDTATKVRWSNTALQLQPASAEAWYWAAWLAAQRGRGDLEQVLSGAVQHLAPRQVRRVTDRICAEYPALCE